MIGKAERQELRAVVSELVPAVRLLELERSLNGDPPTERIP